MKSYKSKTKNKGTTIILENVDEAIKFGRKWYAEYSDTDKISEQFWYNAYQKDSEGFEACATAISKGDTDFKNKCNDIIDDIIDLIDAIKPVFSLNRQGIKFEEEGGFTVAPELAAMGDPKCMVSDKKHNEELEVRKGIGGEGAYRIIINTDVSWWGKPEDNCALVGALILLLQRFATVEVWIQQGWLGSSITDGVTLFKLDFSMASDITTLAFWITNPGKDVPFSMAVNKGLGRESTATSCAAELEADLMVRGDWQRVYKLSYHQLQNMLYTEKIDLMCRWISETAFKIVFNSPDDSGEWISEDRPIKPLID